ncbi:hypothetical protein MUDAN_BIHEEGNE_03171 [Lactiplantibacillus mudanjiangensis]|uniref:hypothetical protein n=1 Tax=Lactiplantibacillus mudanjiangensis TaxID=1296538 RepID=UPI001014AA14|nr:hypothetical protein MUDAN_BIHEEGNE_03171 [Lactiplantibacillus mudanjiangensis]
MALTINQSLAMNAATKTDDGKVIANFYATVSPQDAANNLQMTIVDRDAFVANMDQVKTDLQTFVDDFTAKYTTDSK